MTLGHYFGNCYQEAKQDSAVRAGLVKSERLFSEAQLAEIYQSVQQTMYADLELTRAQEKTLQSVSEQITDLLPDIEERRFQSQSMEQSRTSMTSSFSPSCLRSARFSASSSRMRCCSRF